MTSNGQRIVTGFVGIVSLLLIILFLPYQHHLAFSLVILAAALIGSMEMHRMLVHDRPEMRLPLPSWAGAVLPVAAYIEYSIAGNNSIILYTLIALMSLSFMIETITGHHDSYQGSRERMAFTLVQIFYPNLFAIFFVRMCFLENAWMWMLSFFLTVFSSDTFAYFFGRAFGKNNKGIVKVSPNKSVAGFIAGALVPAIIFTLLAFFFDNYGLSPLEGFAIGLLTAFAAICGDLIESAFKRSANLKDSGGVIPGRGGVMDSIDSLIMAAPIYIAILHIFQAAI